MNNIFDKYKYRRIYENNRLDYKYLLKGGSENNKQLILKYRDIDLYFDKKYDDGKKYILLSNLIKNDDNFKDNSCVIIEIDKDNKMAIIEAISADKFDCFYDVDFNLKNKGSFYLKISIKMLEKYKDKFKINKIVLRDNATVHCEFKEKSFSFNLSQFLLLTNGYTWYGKYGFKINKEHKKEFDDSLKISNNIKIKEINFGHIFSSIEKSDNFIYVNKSIYKIFKKSIKNNSNNLLKDILHFIFYKNKNINTCILYSIMIRFLLKELAIHNYLPLIPTTYYKHI